MACPPFILSLKLDESTFAYFDQLRQRHFPPTRNLIPAHVTLFHQLPGEQAPELNSVLCDLCASTPTLNLRFPTLRFLGKGVAVEVVCPELIQLRQHLAQGWVSWLTPQDQQGYRPHITIQNKTSVTEARDLYQSLSQTWQEIQGHGVGLLLWYYQGGPWELAAEFPFRQQGSQTQKQEPMRTPA